jgi:hypothetical protein
LNLRQLAASAVSGASVTLAGSSADVNGAVTRTREGIVGLTSATEVVIEIAEAQAAHASIAGFRSKEGVPVCLQAAAGV